MNYIAWSLWREEHLPTVADKRQHFAELHTQAKQDTQVVDNQIDWSVRFR